MGKCKQEHMLHKKTSLNKFIGRRISNHGKKANEGIPGRQSLQDELLKALVINKCWERINDLLDNPKTDQEFLNLLASEIAKKTISE